MNLKDELKNVVFNHKISLITNHLNRLSSISREYGIKVFKSYMERFELVQSGFRVEGEQFSLTSYVIFWDQLNILQQARKQNKQPNIIVRVTHSIDISLWETDRHPHSYNQAIESLYTVQEEFIKNGGIIVRIIIGNDSEPIQRYKSVMDRMEKIGVEVRYLDKTSFTISNYDFLYLYDEGILVKLFSSPGNNFSELIIEDTIEDECIRGWKNAISILKRKGTPIASIIEERQIPIK